MHRFCGIGRSDGLHLFRLRCKQLFRPSGAVSFGDNQPVNAFAFGAVAEQCAATAQGFIVGVGRNREDIQASPNMALLCDATQDQFSPGQEFLQFAGQIFRRRTSLAYFLHDAEKLCPRAIVGKPPSPAWRRSRPAGHWVRVRANPALDPPGFQEL